MKIGLKVAKYRCPHCKEVYELTPGKLKLLSMKVSLDKGKRTIVGLPTTVKSKYKNMVATYKYMKQLQENMKKDPNWSNYYKEQREMKEGEKKESKIKSFFRKK